MMSDKPGVGPIFEVMMPNGKRFGDCTFEDLEAEGEALHRIAEKLRVSGELTLGDLSHIQSWQLLKRELGS
jgi:hypothetical protein